MTTHNEPPELVIETLESLKELDYPSYEVIVLDNNTTDPELWRPVEAFCAEAGLRARTPGEPAVPTRIDLCARQKVEQAMLSLGAEAGGEGVAQQHQRSAMQLAHP